MLCAVPSTEDMRNETLAFEAASESDSTSDGYANTALVSKTIIPIARIKARFINITTFQDKKFTHIIAAFILVMKLHNIFYELYHYMAIFIEKI